MQGERKSLDVIVRGIDEMSVSLSSALIQESKLRFSGALLDPSTESRAAVNLQVSITRDLVPEHIPPTAVWQLELVDLDDVGPIWFRWNVERYDLGDGYVLRDARIESDLGPVRLLAIEDIVASVAIGAGAAAGAYFGWRLVRERWAQKMSKKLWDDCIARDGSPSWVYEIEDEASIGPEGPKIRSKAVPRVSCDMSQLEG